MTQAVLETHELAIGYTRPHRLVATAIRAALQPGELVCLLGPNGGGKSTLIRTLAGMQKPLHGTISLQGQDLHSLSPQQSARQLSVVLTERVDAGTLSAYELVSLGRYPYTEWSGRLTAQDHAVVQQALQTLGVFELAPRSIHELSDGERQKVMIARALAQEPTVMILDEPTAFLDLPRRVDVMSVLHKLVRETGRAVLLSTHDLDLALRSADKIWLLPVGGPLQAGAPEDLVLNGALQAAFCSQGVDFDPATGSFKLHRHPVGQVDLTGHGLAALWTERALERAGFQANKRGRCSALRVVVDGETSPAIWRVTTAEGERECHSLYDLLTCLRAADSIKPG